MKKLSDYQGEAAIDLWADLLEPLTVLLGDEGIKNAVRAGKPKTEIAKEILKNHKKEASEILLRIDPEPINGLNLVLRLVAVITDIGKNEEIASFFGYAVQANQEENAFGSATESTEAKEI